MRIKGFVPFINNHLEKCTLENTSVVIDGQNFFYNTYKDSQCNILTGGDHDKYATYLRKIMKIFQRNKVTCYVIFKSGHPSLYNRTAYYKRDVNNAVTLSHPPVGSPILSRHVVRQVLDELGIKYAAGEYKAKKDIVDLAIALDCPIISSGIEFYFYRVDYVPLSTINMKNGKVECKIYNLERFLRNQKISEDALIVFGAILNEKYFKKGFFIKYLPTLNHTNAIQIIKILLTLLKSGSEEVRQKVFSNIDDNSKKKFEEAENFVRSRLVYEGRHSFLVNFFLKGGLQFEWNDSLWLEKGICLGFVYPCYVDLIRHRLLFGSWDAEDLNAEDSLKISIEIIRYVYDLLTGYDGSTFTFMCRDGTNPTEVEVTKASSIPKPDIFIDNIFNNGWSDFTPFFDVFLRSIPIDTKILEHQVPESAHILMITLIYLGRRGRADPSFTYSLLLCYLLLDICLPTKIAKKVKATRASTKTGLVKFASTEKDRRIAAAVMKKYFKGSDSELKTDLDRKALHKLVQFQHCLVHINGLNMLCATKYPTTIYYKTFNGTFIYNMMKQLEMETLHLSFLKKMLSNAPTVLSLFLSLVSTYECLV